MDQIRRASRMLPSNITSSLSGLLGQDSTRLPIRDDEKRFFARHGNGRGARYNGSSPSRGAGPGGGGGGADNGGGVGPAGSRFGFFRRPLRLRGNSSISVPLGILILFPCLVVALILMLFLQHPSSPGMRFMGMSPSGKIRWVKKFPEPRFPRHDRSWRC